MGMVQRKQTYGVTQLYLKLLDYFTIQIPFSRRLHFLLSQLKQHKTGAVDFEEFKELQKKIANNEYADQVGGIQKLKIQRMVPNHLPIFLNSPILSKLAKKKPFSHFHMLN